MLKKKKKKKVISRLLLLSRARSLSLSLFRQLDLSQLLLHPVRVDFRARPARARHRADRAEARLVVHRVLHNRRGGLPEAHGALERLEVGLHGEGQAEGVGEKGLGGALAQVGAEADAARLLEVAALFDPVLFLKKKKKKGRGRVFFLCRKRENFLSALSRRPRFLLFLLPTRA